MSMKQYCDGGEAILEAFRALGTDYIMSSPGSEWSPVWEALARQKVNQKPGPQYFESWHETLAVDMAMGATQITGKPQAVLLHAGAGLLQGTAGLHSAVLSETPMVVLSGKSLTFGENPQLDIEGQWYRSLSIIGGPQRLVEPVTKWATQVTSSWTLYESIIRAVEFAQRTPAGPVYLNVPLETMLHEWTPPEGDAAPLPPRPRRRRSRRMSSASPTWWPRPRTRSFSPTMPARIRNRSRRSSNWPICSARPSGSAARPTPISRRTIRCIWATASTAI